MRRPLWMSRTVGANGYSERWIEMNPRMASCRRESALCIAQVFYIIRTPVSRSQGSGGYKNRPRRREATTATSAYREVTALFYTTCWLVSVIRPVHPTVPVRDA